MLRLIDDILDLSKIEAGKIEILTDEVNVTEIPQMMKNMFEPVAAKKNLTFEVLTDPNVPNVIIDRRTTFAANLEKSIIQCL